MRLIENYAGHYWDYGLAFGRKQTTTTIAYNNKLVRIVTTS